MAEEIQPLGTAEGVEDGLVNCMKNKLHSISNSPPLSPHICRVPATIRKDNHVYYNPKIVSIGPFHRGSTNLQAMEEHKWGYLRNVLRTEPALEECVKKMKEKEEKALEKCVKKMKEKEEKARQCYSGNINMGRDEFVKMMILDGSFIIQLLLLPDKIEENDPIRRNNIWMVPAIAVDMLLLENQLPFCVLECLAECIGRDADALKKEALQFFSSSLPDILNQLLALMPNTIAQSANNKTTEIHHLLHLVHWSLLKPAPPSNAKPFCAQLLQGVRKILCFPSLGCSANNKHENKRLTDQVQEAGASFITMQPEEAPASSITEEQENTIPTATELEEAGVVFKRNKGGSFLDVTFENGVMQLPRLQITDDTNSLFRNLIAFEQCFRDLGLNFTSYCIFMDSLVNTPRDVQILKQSNIIESKLGSYEEVAVLFNQLLKGIAGSLNTGSVRQASIDVSNYAKNRWPRWRAALKRDYFSNPWAAIAFIAAVYALLLSSVGTYHAVF